MPEEFCIMKLYVTQPNKPGFTFCNVGLPCKASNNLTACQTRSLGSYNL